MFSVFIDHAFNDGDQFFLIGFLRMGGENVSFWLGEGIVATGTVAALLYRGRTAASWPYCSILALL